MDASDNNTLNLPQQHKQHSPNIIELNTIVTEWKLKNQECVVSDNVDGMHMLNTSTTRNTPEEYGLDENTEPENSAEPEIQAMVQEADIHVGRLSSSTEQGSDIMEVLNINSAEQETNIEACRAELINSQEISAESTSAEPRGTKEGTGMPIVGGQGIAHGIQLVGDNLAKQETTKQTVKSLVGEQRTTGIQLAEDILAKKETGKQSEEINSTEQETGMQAVKSLVGEQQTTGIQLTEDILAEKETGKQSEEINSTEQKTGIQTVVGTVQGIDIQHKENTALTGQKTGIFGISTSCKTGIQALQNVNQQTDGEFTVQDPAKPICNTAETNNEPTQDLTRDELKEIFRLEQYLHELYESDEEEFESQNKTDQEISFDDFEEISLQEKEISTETDQEMENLPKRHGIFCCIRKCLKSLFCCIRPDVDD